MPSHASARRLVLMAVVAVTGPLLLSGCGDDGGDGGDAKAAAAAARQITDAQGRKVKVPTAPKRVVTLSESTTDTALALGLEPVGTTAGRGQSGPSTYLADKASKAQVVATVAEADMEKVAALRPDLILVDASVGAQKTIGKLQEIAPTVFTSKQNENWKTAFTATADALNKKPEAGKWLKDFDSRVADVKGRLGGNEGKSVSVIRWQDGAPSVVGKGDGVVGATLKALGMDRPKDQQGASVGHSEPVSLEKLDTIDGDWMFFGTLGTEAEGEKAYAEAEKVTNFGRLKAERDKHVVVVQGSAWNSAGGPLSAQIILDDIKEALAK
ncbi:ABC transporter substrate-binding protein [Streptomyces sp. NPDC050560]|uniref:ABC transporter substrate-binding protein n=1 Tax=Streptomyces sp. NPDC050560 TaxID=3365630 RepID=UPI00379B663F